MSMPEPIMEPQTVSFQESSRARRDIEHLLTEHDMEVVITVLSEIARRRAAGYEEKAKAARGDNHRPFKVLAKGWRGAADALEYALDICDDLGW